MMNHPSQTENPAKQTPSCNTATRLQLSDIQEAHERIKPWLQATPLVESSVLNEQLQARILFKPEMLQKTGSFKYRGAMHFLSRLSPEEKQRGVIAYSSGNHAQGVAAAARQFNSPAVIVMPEDAPAIKIQNTRYYGAEIVFYDRQKDNREEIANTLATKRGLTLIPPYDHPWTMAGQGTVALELLAEAQSKDITLDQLLIPCSGGGLTAGCVIASKALSPRTKVYAVEPSGYNDTALSLQAGYPMSITPLPNPLCDALALQTPGKITFPVNQALLDGVCVVDDADVIRSIQLIFTHLKLVTEPGGAVGLAALLAKKSTEIQGQTIGVILSGGNSDPEQFQAFLQQDDAHPMSSHQR